MSSFEVTTLSNNDIDDSDFRILSATKAVVVSGFETIFDVSVLFHARRIIYYKIWLRIGLE